MPARLQHVLSLGCAVVSFGKEQDRTVKAWRSPSSPTDSWPEDEVLPESASLGICLSGGGSRAYTAALGSLSALHDLGVLGKARYLSGVSGGSWATSVYTYVQTSEDEVPDDVFLGTVWEPEDATFANLSAIDERCARYSPTRDWDTYFAEEAVKALLNPWRGLDEVWERSVHRTFLEPHGIERDSLFSWTEATRDDAIARNPSLANKKWLVPQRKRPYPIMATTVLGPQSVQPQSKNDFLFTASEVTPLYAGVPYDYNATYRNKHGGSAGTILLGGLVEPIGYDSQGVVSSGLDPSSSEGLLTVKAPPYRDFTWARGASQSSFAPAASLSMDIPFLDTTLDDKVGYFPPSSAEPETQAMLVGDGGNSENSGIYPLLRRRVERIVMIYNPPVAVASRETWDPMVSDPVLGQISDAFAGLWGVYVDPDYNNTMVFPRETFPGIAVALQESIASGKGGVTTVELTTVKNERFGIQAGIRTKVTILYLAPSAAWESRLPADVQAAVHTDTFHPNFPFYPTGDLSLSAKRVNLLATLTGWTAKVNAGEFQDIIGSSEVMV